MATHSMYYMLSAYISAQTYISVFRKAYLWFLSDDKGNWTPSMALMYKTNELQKHEFLFFFFFIFLFLFFMSTSLHLDNSILILDSKVYLKWANSAYLLARSMIQRSTECQYKAIGEHTHLTFRLHFDEYGW